MMHIKTSLTEVTGQSLNMPGRKHTQEKRASSSSLTTTRKSRLWNKDVLVGPKKIDFKRKIKLKKDEKSFPTELDFDEVWPPLFQDKSFEWAPLGWQFNGNAIALWEYIELQNRKIIRLIDGIQNISDKADRNEIIIEDLLRRIEYLEQLPGLQYFRDLDTERAEHRQNFRDLRDIFGGSFDRYTSPLWYALVSLFNPYNFFSSPQNLDGVLNPLDYKDELDGRLLCYDSMFINGEEPTYRLYWIKRHNPVQ